MTIIEHMFEDVKGGFDSNDNPFNDFDKLIDGKMDPVAGFTLGKIKVDGDVGKALEFSKLLKKK